MSQEPEDAKAAAAVGTDIAAGASPADNAASALVAEGVAELRRTEQHGDPKFEAAQEEEWARRQAEISRQAEEARRLKRLRKAQNEKLKQQQVQCSVPCCILLMHCCNCLWHIFSCGSV